MEFEGYEIDDVDDVLLYDKIDEIYCRCCFNIFSPSDVKIKLNKQFLNAIRTLFMLPMTFKEGSNFCRTCNDTVMNFWKFKNEIVKKQCKFSIMMTSNEHKDITKIRNLSQQPVRANELFVHRQEEIFIKEEPNDKVNSIFLKEPEPEIKDEEEVEVVQSPIIICESPEVLETNPPISPPTKKKKEVVENLEPQKVMPSRTAVKRTAYQEEFYVLPPKKSGKYERCKTCGKNSSDLLNHRIKLHGYVYYFRCSGCDYKSKDRRNVTEHITSVHTKQCDRSKFCELCDKTFTSLHNHIENVHKGVKNYFCYLCDFSSFGKNTLEIHMLNSHLPKNFKCTQCDFKTINDERLRKHIFSQHESIDNIPEYYKKRRELHNCPHCQKVLKGVFSLSEHIKRIHEQKLRFKCEAPDCPRYFFSQKEMQRHYGNSHGPRNFICDVCGASFGTNYRLRKHSALHQEPKIICEICGQKFFAKSRLKFHMDRFHLFKKNFKCDQPGCNAEFYAARDILRHKRRRHPNVL